jgi:hypothetical protein
MGLVVAVIAVVAPLGLLVFAGVLAWAKALELSDNTTRDRESKLSSLCFMRIAFRRAV